jgi:hypothetical protein
MTVPLAASDSGELTYDLDVGETSAQIYPTTSTWTDWNTYFGNTDTNNCGITSCTLYESDCSTALSNPVSMAGVSPFDVTALKNVLAGYSQTMCVSCTNGAQTVHKDNWSVSQLTCNTVLTAPTTTLTTSVTYDPLISTETIFPWSGTSTWDIFFSNTDTTNCPITACNIYTSTGAVKTYPFSMDSSSPWGVPVRRNVVNGYSQSSKIECSNIA